MSRAISSGNIVIQEPQPLILRPKITPMTGVSNRPPILIPTGKPMDIQIPNTLTTSLLSLSLSLAIEYFKHRLDVSRQARSEREAGAAGRMERVHEFLQDAQREAGLPVTPAWLKPETFTRRALAAEWGLRRYDEDPTRSVSVRNRTRRQAQAPGSRQPVFLLGPSQVLGRSRRCDLQIMDPTVSSLHAMLVFREGRFMIFDLDSKSGIFVNEGRVSPAGKPLTHRDRIVLGETIFRFSQPDPDPRWLAAPRPTE